MWRKYNPNPTGRDVGDCVVRAVSIALGVDWEEAFALLAEAAFQMGDMPSSNSVLGALMRREGWRRENLPNTCPDCYTFADFARDNPKGVYVLATGKHVATVVDGVLYDNWDSSEQVPQYLWYRKEQ